MLQLVKVCCACRKPIVGRSISAQGKLFHPGTGPSLSLSLCQHLLIVIVSFAFAHYKTVSTSASLP